MKTVVFVIWILLISLQKWLCVNFKERDKYRTCRIHIHSEGHHLNGSHVHFWFILYFLEVDKSGFFTVGATTTEFCCTIVVVCFKSDKKKICFFNHGHLIQNRRAWLHNETLQFWRHLQKIWIVNFGQKLRASKLLFWNFDDMNIRIFFLFAAKLPIIKLENDYQVEGKHGSILYIIHINSGVAMKSSTSWLRGENFHL